MDHEPTRLAADDMGLVAFRDVRLDRYQSLADTRRSEYHLEFRLRGESSKLFIMQGGPLSGMVDRFLELVSLLVGESRVDRITEQTANAVFHGLGGELADLLRAGRRNLAEDSRRSIDVGNSERSRVPESDRPRTSDASVQAPIRSSEDYQSPGQIKEWNSDSSRPRGMPTNNP